MIPESERQHYDAAAAAGAAADIDPPETAEERQAKAEQRSDMRVLQEEAKAMMAAGPRVWQAMEDRTAPRPGLDGMVMRPQVEMDFGQLAAYRMGQQSVVDWIRTLAYMEIPDG